MLLTDLAARTGATLNGDGTVDIVRMATLEDAGPGAIAFLANPKYHRQLASTRAAAVIVAPDYAFETALPKLVSANPYATYAKVATILYPRPAVVSGVHGTAIVGDGARIAGSAAVGPYAVIGARTIVGERARVGAACMIGDDIVIADDALLHARVTVYDGCIIGPRTIVHSGAIIGADGFGMAEEGGRWLKIPQVGRVVIGADVEIGANTTIDRGAIGDTVIEDDVKLDNQIQIGHNCRIGSHTAIAGCTGISGSVRIGRNCKIGGAAMIAGHLSIADGVVISAGTGIMGSIDEPGIYTGIFPMLPYAEWKRVAVAMRRLVSLSARLKVLERSASGGRKTEEGA
jgi:UDP-3-O-[3-hydroxymyristoyl] glucosamine N-acyltransferase